MPASSCMRIDNINLSMSSANICCLNIFGNLHKLKCSKVVKTSLNLQQYSQIVIENLTHLPLEMVAAIPMLLQSSADKRFSMNFKLNSHCDEKSNEKNTCLTPYSVMLWSNSLPWHYNFKYFSLTRQSEYVNRIILYGFQVWGCQLTGKTNLKYGEAVASEEQALKRLENFPKYLEKPILQLVHHSKYSFYICVVDNSSVV